MSLTGSSVYSGRAASSAEQGASLAFGPDGTQRPWLLVAGGFHRNGGMDKANLAVAQYLIDRGTPVHIVCHSIDASLAAHNLVTATVVKRPLGSFFLGRPLLDRIGRKAAKRLLARWPGAKVVVNGDNCLWPGINWVHYVHQAWSPKAREGPFLFRIKIQLARQIMAKRERHAVRLAQVLITNSNRTSLDLVKYLGANPALVRTVYLGAESEWGPVTDVE